MAFLREKRWTVVTSAHSPLTSSETLRSKYLSFCSFAETLIGKKTWFLDFSRNVQTPCVPFPPLGKNIPPRLRFRQSLAWNDRGWPQPRSIPLPYGDAGGLWAQEDHPPGLPSKLPTSLHQGSVFWLWSVLPTQREPVWPEPLGLP